MAGFLTVVALISAIFRAVFATSLRGFCKAYAREAMTPWLSAVDWAYAGFGLYAVAVLVAATLLWAINPSFNVPMDWVGGTDIVPASLFFHKHRRD